MKKLQQSHLNCDNSCSLALLTTTASTLQMQGGLFFSIHVLFRHCVQQLTIQGNLLRFSKSCRSGKHHQQVEERLREGFVVSDKGFWLPLAYTRKQDLAFYRNKRPKVCVNPLFSLIRKLRDEGQVGQLFSQEQSFN